MTADRTVHGWTAAGCELVRYEKAGRWWIEALDGRKQITVQQAAQLAATWRPGLPGGRMFDRLVREIGAAEEEQK